MRFLKRIFIIVLTSCLIFVNSYSTVKANPLIAIPLAEVLFTMLMSVGCTILLDQSIDGTSALDNVSEEEINAIIVDFEQWKIDNGRNSNDDEVIVGGVDTISSDLYSGVKTVHTVVDGVASDILKEYITVPKKLYNDFADYVREKVADNSFVLSENTESVCKSWSDFFNISHYYDVDFEFAEASYQSILSTIDKLLSYDGSLIACEYDSSFDGFVYHIIASDASKRLSFSDMVGKYKGLNGNGYERLHDIYFDSDYYFEGYGGYYGTYLYSLENLSTGAISNYKYFCQFDSEYIFRVYRDGAVMPIITAYTDSRDRLPSEHAKKVFYVDGSLISGERFTIANSEMGVFNNELLNTAHCEADCIDICVPDNDEYNVAVNSHYINTVSDYEIVEVEEYDYTVEVPGSDVETNPDIETDPGVETNPDIETDPGVETNPDIGTVPGVETAPGVESGGSDNTGSDDTGNDNESESGSKTESDDINLLYDLSGVFPFCIPFDLYNSIKLMCASPIEPVFEIPLYFPRIDYTYMFVLDLTEYADLVNLIKSFQVLIFIIGLMGITNKMIKW